MATYGTVDEYVDALAGPAHDVVVNLRAVIHEVLPDVGERISYDIPTFTVDGRSVVHVAGWAKHVSVYPVPESPAGDPTLAADLAPYIGGKGTLRFDLGKPVPYDLVRRVVAALAERARG